MLETTTWWRCKCLEEATTLQYFVPYTVWNERSKHLHYCHLIRTDDFYQFQKCISRAYGCCVQSWALFAGAYSKSQFQICRHLISSFTYLDLPEVRFLEDFPMVPFPSDRSVLVLYETLRTLCGDYLCANYPTVNKILSGASLHCWRLHNKCQKSANSIWLLESLPNSARV